MNFNSISVKVALAATLFFVTALGAISAIEAYLVKGDFREMVGKEQFSLVKGVANEIDEKLTLRMRALERAALAIAESKARDAASLQQAVERLPLLNVLFDDIFIFSVGGDVLVNYPYVKERSRISASERAYFRDVLSKGQTIISEPYQGKLSRQPNVMIATPIFDERGKLVAILERRPDGSYGSAKYFPDAAE